MIIAVVATHAHALPSKAHTGDSQVILDLTRSLCELGHETWLFAPRGTEAHDLVQVQECDVGDDYERQVCEELDAMGHIFDVVHDFTIGKAPAKYCRDNLLRGCKVPYVSTLLGGHWVEPLPNTIVWSQSMRDRVMRGASDYEGTATPEAGGPLRKPFKDVRVVHGGVDTEFYSPEWDAIVGRPLLWLNRWHPVKGYREAIAWAKSDRFCYLTMAGEHPDRDHPYQAECAREAVRLAKGCSRIHFEWLPPDPEHHIRKRELYQQAGGLLYPVQFHEPFGLSMVESMACGTPVVVNDDNRKMGSVLEVTGGDDIDRITARHRAVEMFDRFVMARNYIAAYRDAMDGGWG